MGRAYVLVAVGLRYRKWWLGILFWYTDVTRFGWFGWGKPAGLFWYPDDERQLCASTG